MSLIKGTYLNRKNNKEASLKLDETLNNKDEDKYQFKVILLGDIAVGKTSILKRFIDDCFEKEYYCTVGVEFKMKSIRVNDKETACLQIWDTCGEEKYRTITRQYYRETQGALLVFDLSNRISFEKINDWLNDLKENGPRDVTVTLVGNKCDLEAKEIEIEEIKTILKAHPKLEYFETSALTGKNIIEIFKNLTDRIIRREKGMLKKNSKDSLILSGSDSFYKRKSIQCCK